MTTLTAAKKLLCLLALAALLAACAAALADPAQSPADAFKTAGSCVTFGSYPQSAEGEPAPIEWLVLDYDPFTNRALLISRRGLDARPYHTRFTEMTWEASALRAWLNGEFLAAAFTPAEQAAIQITAVDNGSGQGFSRGTGYARWNTYGGPDTADRVFLLSYAEANRYFGVQHSMNAGGVNTRSRVAPTAWAAARGALTTNGFRTADGEAAGWWWLRSPGPDKTGAAHVFYNGSLGSSAVNDASGLVRPVLWVSLNAACFQ